MTMVLDQGFRATTAALVLMALLMTLLLALPKDLGSPTFGPISDSDVVMVEGSGSGWFVVGLIGVAVGITLLTVATCGAGSIAVAAAVGVAQTTTWTSVLGTGVFGATVMGTGAVMARENQ